jgi:DNA primase
LEEIGRDKLIDTEAIKRNSNLLALVESDVKLIKISTTGDGEYEAPCPFCGGKDRFHIQPFFEGGARWFCRNCTNSKWQDVINYVMRREKCDFITACRKLTNGDLPQTNQMIRHEHTSTPYAPPQVDWQSEARKYIARCQEDLWTNPKAKKALEYLRKDRGLKDDTILHFKLGYSSGIQGEGDFYVAKGITIPCSIKDDIWYIKIRLVPGEVTKCGYCKEFIPGPGICPKCGKENKYKGVKGNRPAALYNADDLVEGDLALLTEGEFDCQIAWQELNKYVPCVTMGSATNIPDLTTWGEYLRRPCVLLAAYDNDNPGSTRAHEMAKMLGEVVKLVALPAGIKDINALYLSGADLYNWIKGYLIFYKLPGGFSGTKIIK